MGSICQLAGASGVQPGASSTVSTDFTSGPVTGAGTFSVNALGSPPDQLITLNLGDPTTWTCSCPSSCRYGVTVSNPGTSGINYFVSQARASWFQTVGGDVHANNGGGGILPAIRNPLSSICSGACKPYTSLRDTLSTINSSGIISYNNGSVDTWSDYGKQTYNLDEDDRHLLVDSNHNKPIENFAYFWRRFELRPQEVGGVSDDFEFDYYDAAKPTDPPLDNRPAYYHPGDMTISSSPWNVGVGEKLTIFVDGNLTIENTTTVTPGGFLAFIVKGDIIFPATFGDPDPAATAALVQGVFIANGTIDVQSLGGTNQDLKFIGEGTFAGLSGVQLSRDYHNTANNQNPTELFRFRPDFLINLPQDMKKPLYTWRPVAP